MTATARTPATSGRDGLLLTAATVLAGAVNYGYTLVVTRALAPPQLVAYAGAAAVLLAAGTLAEAALPWLLARELTRHRDAAGRRTALSLTLSASIAQAAAAALISAVLVGRLGTGATKALVAVTAVTVLTLFAGCTLVGYAQGTGRFRTIAGIRVMESVLKIGVGTALLAAGSGAAGALSGQLAADGAVLAIGLWLARHELRWQAGALRSRDLWRAAGTMTVLQGLLALIGASDSITVALLPVGAPAAAGYQLAVVLSRGPQFLAAALALVSFTAMVEHGVARALAAGLRIFALVAVPGALAVAVLPVSLLTVLFPHNVHQLRPVLPITALSSLLLGLIGLLVTAFQARLELRAAASVLLAAALAEPLAITVAARMAGLQAMAATVAVVLALLACGLGALLLQDGGRRTAQPGADQATAPDQQRIDAG